MREIPKEMQDWLESWWRKGCQDASDAKITEMFEEKFHVEHAIANEYVREFVISPRGFILRAVYRLQKEGYSKDMAIQEITKEYGISADAARSFVESFGGQFIGL